MGAQGDGQMTLAGTAGSACSCRPAARGILPLQIQLWAQLHLHCVPFEPGHAVQASHRADATVLRSAELFILPFRSGRLSTPLAQT